jgi:hypothetical protein
MTAAHHHDHLLGDRGPQGAGISQTGCGCHAGTHLLATQELTTIIIRNS